MNFHWPFFIKPTPVPPKPKVVYVPSRRRSALYAYEQRKAETTAKLRAEITEKRLVDAVARAVGQGE